MSKSKELLNEAENLFKEAREEAGYYYEIQVARKGIELLKQVPTELLKEVKDIMDVMEKRLCGDCLFNSGFKVLQLKLKELEGDFEFEID